MGSLRRSALLGLAGSILLGSLAVCAPRPAWCDDDTASLTKVGKPAGDGVLTLQAEQTFTGGGFSSHSLPISVSIANRGADQEAVLETRDVPGYSANHAYRRTIQLAGGGAVTRATLYPNFQYYPSNVQVQLSTGHGVRATVTTNVNGYGREQGNLALISDRLGALQPVLGIGSSDTPPFQNGYVKPLNAPDRAEGYRSVKVLVAGDGAERLTPPQWRAIRQWVSGGGSLIVLGQKGWAQAGPGFAELSPERVNEPSQMRVSDDVQVDGAIDSLMTDRPLYGGVKATAISAPLAPGAIAMPTAQQAQQPLFARRQIGAGCVLYCAFDLTDRALRTRDLPKMWQVLANRAAPFNSYVKYEDDDNSTSLWAKSGPATDAAHDPFHLALPHLTEIVYIFAAYFVLAVPMTFVVLKRTRRMNLAWASGPVLAVVFAGVLYLFSARLYLAPLSRRTAGNIYAAAGDREARFVGLTEMFFPHAGSYDVTIPHSDSVEYIPRNDNWTQANQGATLETMDDGETVHTPELGVTNLAFRRLYHSETIGWGTGITADLRKTGTLEHWLVSGTITNGTGLTLRNVVIKLPISEGVALRVARTIDVLPPGTTTLPPTGVQVVGSQDRCSSPMLTGNVDGKSMGPQVGSDVSGEGTVGVVVSLPAILDAKDGGR